MLIIKENPVGIDIPMQQLQTFLHDQLLQVWNIADDRYRCYGRCYRNKKDSNKYKAENYEGGNEYKDAYWDDRIDVTSFFGEAAVEKYDIANKVAVHLVFFCNLEKLKPTVTHRADEEVRKDVQTICETTLFGFRYVSTELWAENCLREYPGSARDLEFKIDMHPVHCFRLNFELNYNKNICA